MTRPQKHKRKYYLGCFDIEVRRIALMKEQVIEWKLPPAPVKISDTRSATWTGIGQVELDAIEPNTLQTMCRDAIKNIFEENVANNLYLQEQNEAIQFRSVLKDFVSTL